MSIGERLKTLRRELKLSQTDLGMRLGVTLNVISNIEQERLARPEQKEPLLKLICKEFNVSYDWLTAGQGDMFEKPEDSFIDILVDKYNLSPNSKNIIECFLSFSEEKQQVLLEFIHAFADACERGTSTEQIFDELTSKNAKHSTVSKPEKVYFPNPRLQDTENANELTPEMEKEVEREVDEYREYLLKEKRQEQQALSAKESDAI